MKKIITFFVILLLIGGGVGLGLFINNRNNTATTIAVVGVESIETNSQQSQSNSSEYNYRRKNVSIETASPSLQFVLNSKNKVLSMTYLNSDADVVFVNLDAEGRDFVEVMRTFTQIAVNTGTVKVDGRSYIDIEITANNQQKIEKLNQKLTNAINKVFDENGIFGTLKSTVNVSTENLQEKYNSVSEAVGINLENLQNKTEVEILQQIKERSQNFEGLSSKEVETFKSFYTNTLETYIEQINNLMEKVKEYTEQLEKNSSADSLEDMIGSGIEKGLLQSIINDYQKQINQIQKQIDDLIKEKVSELQKLSKQFFEQAKEEYEILINNYKNTIQDYKNQFEQDKEDILLQIKQWRESLNY